MRFIYSLPIQTKGSSLNIFEGNWYMGVLCQASLFIICTIPIIFLGVYAKISGYDSLLIFAVILIFVIAFIIFFLNKKNQIIRFLKNIFISEREQTTDLLESLNDMVNKLEYRDNVLVVEKKRAEDASRAKSDFLAHMSHELRTPMHAILNFAEMGKNKIGSVENEKIKLYFTRIEESSERLVRLIDNLLDLTRLEEGKTKFEFKKNNIVNCIKYACDEMNSLFVKKSIKIDIQKNNCKEILIFDKDHIIRVLINLISNAVKYSHVGSTITIILESGKFNISGKEPADGLKVSIVDQGSGIAEGELEMIFHKFIQGTVKAGKDIGSGLGLAIAREIVTAHGGIIWAQNDSGGGACLAFIIPENLELAGES